ncbi:MAG: hypothetical protein JSV27_12010 [Candidatus Bathyarchaeota archaeon]|nr:MAG: hypothetical protein JSV27_12010 [Candidatus Bathyarchaeota archaeon]
MVIVTISNIAPLKKEAKTRMYANKLEDNNYEADYIEDATTGVEYYSSNYMRPKEKAEFLEMMKVRGMMICFEIKEIVSTQT